MEYREWHLVVCILCSLVMQELVMDRSKKGFSCIWGRLVMDVIERPWWMAWGLAILVDMYHELHEIVYRDGRTWAYGAMSVQIWA